VFPIELCPGLSIRFLEELESKRVRRSRAFFAELLSGVFWLVVTTAAYAAPEGVVLPTGATII